MFKTNIVAACKPMQRFQSNVVIQYAASTDIFVTNNTERKQMLNVLCKKKITDLTETLKCVELRKMI